MKKSRKMKTLLEQLRKIPNVSMACEKVGVARNTYYTWLKADPDFRQEVDEAVLSGTDSINDLAESKLLTHINNGNLRAIEYWLNNNKKSYIKPREKITFKANQPAVITSIEMVSIDDISDD
jgi:ACT domain-containing protein